MSTPILLATSPAAWPPMPSQTTKMPWRESKPKLSSLFVRTHPTSVLPATSTASAICGFRVLTAELPLIVPFATIIPFSKQTVGEFNIAGGDSCRARHLIAARPFLGIGQILLTSIYRCKLRRAHGLTANVDHTARRLDKSSFSNMMAGFFLVDH